MPNTMTMPSPGRGVSAVTILVDGYFRLLKVVIAVFLVAMVVLVFGNALSQLNAAEQREATMQAEANALQAELDAGRRELTLVQTDAFQALEARALGYGASGELVSFRGPAKTGEAAVGD